MQSSPIAGISHVLDLFFDKPDTCNIGKISQVLKA
jgi:hypothetical protein